MLQTATLTGKPMAQWSKYFVRHSATRPALTLLCTAVLLRWPTFWHSVLDHDESTYLVVAWEMLEGELLYKDLIDLKPPGIFLLFAAQLAVFKSIVWERLLSALVVGWTAYGLYRAQKAANYAPKAAWATGFLYIALTGLFKNYGLAVNTELYFNAFTIWGLYWFLQADRPIAGRQRPFAAYAFGGFLMGWGFLVKYAVLFDFAAFMAWACVAAWWIGVRIQTITIKLVPQILVAGCLMALPWLCCYGYYLHIGQMAAFDFVTREAPGRYLKDFSIFRALLLLGDFFLRFLPVTGLAVYAFFRQPVKPIRWLGPIWLAAACTAVALPGNHFFHYTIQLMLPLAWMAAQAWDLPEPRPAWWSRWMAPTWLYPRLIGLFVLVMAMHIYQYLLPADHSRALSRYLNSEMRPEETLYAANSQQILYFLTNQNCPTPYIHNTLLFDKRHIAVLKIDTTAEMTRILAKRPDYILQTGPLLNTQLQRYLSEQYRPRDTVGPTVVWKRH